MNPGCKVQLNLAPEAPSECCSLLPPLAPPAAQASAVGSRKAAASRSTPRGFAGKGDYPFLSSLKRIFAGEEGSLC